MSTTTIPILPQIMLKHLNIVKFDEVCENLCEFIGYNDPFEAIKIEFVEYIHIAFGVFNKLTLSNYRLVISCLTNAIYEIHDDLFTSEKDCYNYLFSEFLGAWETPSTIIQHRYFCCSFLPHTRVLICILFVFYL